MATANLSMPFGVGIRTLISGAALSPTLRNPRQALREEPSGERVRLEIECFPRARPANGFTPGPQRVDVIGDPELPGSERTVDRYFGTTALAQPARFTFGNSGRDILTGPGIVNFDMSLLKNHRWGERYNVQFRFKAFNIFNTALFNERGHALGAANFGVISSAGSPRSLHFGLKFEF